MTFKQLKQISFALVLMAAAGSLFAQSESDSDAANNNDEQTQEQNKKAQPKRKQKEKSDTFIPTEEISEDAPVAFPVDI